jgi:hypothetical protein
MTKTMLSVAAASSLLLGAGAAFAQEGGRRFTTPLTGVAEVPGPGDPDGRGAAEIRVNPGRKQVCFTLRVSNIDPATGAHIHEGAPTEAGPVVVTLAPPAGGTSRGCVAVTRELALEIIRTPTNYYVNVHNAAFPKGAVRGQLGK